MSSEHFSLLVLVHLAWTWWPGVSRTVLSSLGVHDTCGIIRLAVDTGTCKANQAGIERIREVLERILASEPMVEEARRQLEALAGEDAWATPFYSAMYPCELLRYQARGFLCPPLVLYWHGARIDPNERPAVAVVGTRRCSPRGRALARSIGRLVARHRLVLVTGLAECIDAEAAKGALEEGGTVIGVRPWLSPLSLPRESKQLVSFLGRGLTIVAENPWRPRSGRVGWLYFLRNRLVAGMSKLVVVVEALPGGGSTHQVELALRRGKPVLVYEPPPGTPYHDAYRLYVDSGARVFRSLDEVERVLQGVSE